MRLLLMFLILISITTSCEERILMSAPFLEVYDFCYPQEKEIGDQVTYYVPINSNDECGDTTISIDQVQNVTVTKIEQTPGIIDFIISDEGSWFIEYTVCCNVSDLCRSAMIKGIENN